MVRTVGTLACCCLLAFAAPVRALAQDGHAPDPHIRSRDGALLDALESGARASETLRALVERIEASDVIVYVERRPSRIQGVAAHLSFVSAAGGRRYLHVEIDSHYVGCDLMALLAHELRHAVEIADEPSVVDARSLAACYRTVGFAVAGRESERFESGAAIAAGRQVMREVSARGSVASRAR